MPSPRRRPPSPSARRLVPPSAEGAVFADAAFAVASVAAPFPNAAGGYLAGYLAGQYAFMLPVAVVVATSCQLAGIGGAALFSPIFLLLFPYLGPQYPLDSAGAALASALLTECFGFASGLTGYARRGLVDWEVAGRFLVSSVPTALVGAVSAKYVTGNPALLQTLYATLMLALASYLLLSPRPDEIADEDCEVLGADGEQRELRSKIAADGTKFSYLAPERGSKRGLATTSAGGSLTGLLGVGIGEVMLPQLVRGCCMPLPVAAGTSVAIVVTTALTAATVQFLTLASSVEGDGTLLEGLVAVVPWNLVQYTVPGVLVGGQLAPFLASRGMFSDDDVERFAIALFTIVGVAFATKASSGFM